VWSVCCLSCDGNEWEGLWGCGRAVVVGHVVNDFLYRVRLHWWRKINVYDVEGEREGGGEVCVQRENLTADVMGGWRARSCGGAKTC
jgi:hypothetical protein